MGLMRLPLLDENDERSINQEEVNQMVDAYMERGYNYFDTGYRYHDYLSEIAFRKAVVERYPREDYIIADKFPIAIIEEEGDLERIFNEQLEKCGLNYFDYYMLHNVNVYTRKAAEKVNAFQFILDKKAEGKIKHIGISFHDKAKLLKEYLDKYPEIEFVQLQINYVDWDNNLVEAKKCYNLVKEYNKDFIIMEPLKGGVLANIPQSVDSLFKKTDSKVSPVEWAFKFCASLNPMVILSGASSLEQMRDNLDIFDNIEPLSYDEFFMLGEASVLVSNSVEIPCTDCNYCIRECKHNIPIPKYFKAYNDLKRPNSPEGSILNYYNTLVLSDEYGSPHDCEGCGDCTKECPQNINIAKYLKKIAKEFESLA